MIVSKSIIEVKSRPEYPPREGCLIILLLYIIPFFSHLAGILKTTPLVLGLMGRLPLGAVGGIE